MDGRELGTIGRVEDFGKYVEPLLEIEDGSVVVFVSGMIG